MSECASETKGAPAHMTKPTISNSHSFFRAAFSTRCSSLFRPAAQRLSKSGAHTNSTCIYRDANCIWAALGT